MVDSAVSLKRHGDAQRSNETMSDADREKRRRAQSEKKKKLVNPLFFVSPTRLSIRNLRKSVNHSQLFSLCYKAAKAGLKNGLVEKKDIENFLIAQSVPIRQRTPALLAIPEIEGIPQNKVVKKAKVMLDSGRLRGADKHAQSRGYGFVEFGHHAHALACLRELNHNFVYGREYATQYGAPGDKKHNLIVEFSLENYQKVKVLNSRIEKRNLSESTSNEDDKNIEDSSLIGQKRVLDQGVDDIEVFEVEEENEMEIKKEKNKSRLEKKMERSQKRKAKELKRKENKKRKLEGSVADNLHAGVADKNSNNNSQANVGLDDENKKTWGGFKRYRAKKKEKK